MKTERLIAALASEAGPVDTLRPPSHRAAGWLLVALPLVAAGLLLLGTRPDLGARMAAPMFLLVLALAAASAVALAGAAMAAAVPGRLDRGASGWVPLALLFAWGASTVGLVLADGLPLAPTFGWPSPACVLKIAALGALPAAAAFRLVRRGAALHRFPAAALAVGAGLALASAAVPLACPIDAGGHIFFMHFLPVPLLALGLGALLAPQLTWLRR